MAIRELQTAAARVLVVDRVTDADLDQLRERFGYHPHDLEEVFRVPVESACSTYGGYAFLTWLWPNLADDDADDLRLFIDAQRIVFIGDTADHDARRLYEQLVADTGSTLAQRTAPELLHEFLRQLTDRVNTSQHQPSIKAVRLLGEVTVAVRQCGRWLQSQGSPTAVPSLVLDAHRLDSLADRFRAANAAAPRPEPAPVTLPRLVRAYAFASAVMVVLVIVTLSLH